MTVVSKKPRATAASNAKKAESESDGAWIDAKGVQLGHIRVGDIIPVRPAKASSETVAVFVNGMLFSADQHFKALQEVADATGYPVVGLHNATQSLVNDVVEAVRQKLGYATKDPSVRALTEYLKTGLELKRELVLIAHSQGALVIAVALQNVVTDMRKSGMSDTQIERKLKAISVETYGGVTNGFPSGPHYKHYINCKDALPKLIGPGATTIGQLITRARQLGMDHFEPGVRNNAEVHQVDLGTEPTGEYLPGHGLGIYLGFRSKNKE